MSGIGRWTLPMLVLVVECHGQVATRNDSGEGKMKAVSGTPAKWTEGPALQPAAVLLDWLERHARTETGTRRLFRLPVVVRFEDAYRLAIESAFIGTSEADRNSDSVCLRLDDTGMGMSLVSQLGPYCAGSSRVCRVWLEGYWGRLVEVPLPEREGDVAGKPFAVLKVVGAVQGPPDAARPAVLMGP